MVIPEGTESGRSRPGKGGLITFAVAGVVIVVGFVALGSLSPTDPAAIEATTTTGTTLPDVDPADDPENFSVSQIATGPPLEWDRVAESATGYPLTITEHEGLLYLFASGQAPWAREPGGLITWRSTDVEDWQPVGETVIGREFQVTDVIASADGFVAIGARPGGGNLIIWRSGDGIEWRAAQIPTDAESPYLSLRPTAAATFEDGVAIAPHYELDQERLVVDRLAAIGVDVDLPMMSWTTRYAAEGGVELTVRGPLGLPVLTTSLHVLRLNEQEHRWLMGGLDRGEPSEIWVVDGTGNRESGTIPLNWVTTMVSQPDGTLFASGFGGAGLNGGFVSANGLHWEESDEGKIGRAISWGDRLIGVTSGPELEVLMSSDGQTWVESGFGDFLPSQILWHPAAMGAGPDGLAMTIEGQSTAGRLALQARAQRSLSSGRATLTADHQRSVYVLEIDDETHTWDMFPPGATQVPEELELDLPNEAVLLKDPETGETLARFGFEELRGFESGPHAVSFSDVIGHRALAVTRDGVRWEIGDLGLVVGDDSRVMLITVAQGRLAAVVAEPHLDPTQTLPAGFEIWTAPLP